MIRALALALLVAVAAHAEPANELAARRLYDVGTDAYRHGFYDEALSAFGDAYKIHPRPAFLFNMALCFEGLKQFAEAAVAYRQYLALEHNLPDRARIEARAAELEARARAPSPSPAPELRAPPPLEPLGAPPLSPPPLETRAARLRRGVVGSAIATSALTVVAIGLTFGAASQFGDYAHACRSGTSGCSDDASSSLLRLDHASDAMWAIAAAGAITTLALHLLWRHAR